MNLQQQQTQIQTAKKQVEKQELTAYKCPNCGAAYSAADNFCSECGMGLKGNSCVHCGAETKPNWEICPACGRNLQAELCSFCGGKMTPDDAFCPDCGNPRTGIMCASCNTLNFRSFCRKCNAPLNALAQQALEEARKDPKVQKAIAIAQELEELEQILLSMAEEEAAPPELPEISEEDRALVNQYKDLLAAFRQQKPQEKKEEPPVETPKPKPQTTFSINIVSKEEAAPPELPQISEEERALVDQYKDLLAAFRGQKPQEKTEAPPVETPKPEPKPKPKTTFSINIVSKEEAMKKYKEKLSEMQETLASMIPDVGMTPQMQRDYYSARKVEIVTRTTTRVKVPLYWICNAYGCQHNQPNECSEPFRGGTWVYDEKDVTTVSSTWVHQ